MSSGSQVAVLGARRRERCAAASPRGRPRLTLLAFALLGVYGVLRWGTMLAHEPTRRLFGLVAVSVAVAVLGELAHTHAREQRIAAIVAIALCVIAVIPISGFPLHWVLHLRIDRTARAIGDGLSALPSVNVPYDGSRHWTEAVIVLGAGLLLLAAALELASSRRPHGAARLAGVALAMTVLAVVPSSLARPQIPFLHGVLLFLLLAALVFSERVPVRRGWPAAGAVVLAASAALLLAPGLASRSAWLNVQTLAGTLGPARGEAFDWAQTYGPLAWPHTGRVVLDVAASRFPAYWKTEDLDEFDGHGWVSTLVGGDEQAAFEETVSRPNLARWDQTLTVTLQDMSTADVIAAGVVYRPSIGTFQPGNSFGTYTSTSPLGPDDVYQVPVYTPQPSPAQLAAAGTNYPAADLMPELEMLLGPSGPAGSVLAHLPSQPIQFTPYGSRARLEGYAGLTAAQELALLDASPYGPVYALARRLRRGARTPYAYVEAVMRHLSSGYTYDLTPALSSLPIVTFLLHSKLGYCQQFAGAMALLLRMGGIPAHVSTGFTTGTYDSATHAYEVSDTDAHAWVEAWFPAYGWITFDPTSAAQSTAGQIPSSTANSLAGAAQRPAPAVRREQRASAAATAGRRPAGRRSSDQKLAILLACLLALIAAVAGVKAGRRRAAPDAEKLLVELERAFARCGRPLTSAVTLASLEQRFSSEPEAAGYIRAIRLARFAPAAPTVTAAQRRALRRQLRVGLGASGALRALLALPPSPARRGASGARWS
ncbi:MAG: transglutaminase-like domain-containing protein [Solirubrobacteraceae bacterium]